MFGYQVNEATIWAANGGLHEHLDSVETTIKASLQAGPLIYVDKTGLRVKGKLGWLHRSAGAVAYNQTFTYLFVRVNRKKIAPEPTQSIVNEFSGWLIHDCWQAYFGLTKARHGLCRAHLIRELETLFEQGSLWAGSMQRFLLDAYKASRHGPVGLDQQVHRQGRYTLTAGFVSTMRKNEQDVLAQLTNVLLGSFTWKHA